MVKQYVVHCVYLQSAQHSALSIVTRVTKDQSCAAARARPRASLNFEKFEICKMVPSKIGPCHVMSSLEIYLHPIHFCIPSFPLSPTWTYFASIQLCRRISRPTQPQHHRKYEDNSIQFLQPPIDDDWWPALHHKVLIFCRMTHGWLRRQPFSSASFIPGSACKSLLSLGCKWTTFEKH